jgi:thiol-disulfide isomerase/thioredoxin
MREFSLLLIFFHLLSAGLRAQNNSPSDSIYQQIIQKYEREFAEIVPENRFARDSLSALRAAEFEVLYKAYPSSGAARKGLEIAFGAWLNVDELEKMQNYLNTVSVNDELWVELAGWIRHAYSNRGLHEEFYAYFEEMYDSEAITNHRSKSLIAYRLGKYWFSLNDHIKAREYFLTVIDLNADSVEVEQANREIYDMNTLSVGNPAPDFSAISLDGEPVELSALRGKFVFLEFWATWCGPCIPEVPYLIEAYEEYGGRDDFIMIGISLDMDEERLRSFVNAEDIEWTQIQDRHRNEYKWNGEIAHSYAVGNGIPKSFLIDKDGVIVAKDLRKERLREVLAKYLIQ